MINLIKKISKNKSALIFALFIILFLPSTIYLPAESNRRLVVSAVGVDKTENQIELSVLMVIPKSAGNIGNNYQLISQKGNTLAEALEKMGTSIGKHISFAHCEIIITSKDVLKENLATYLDFFTRTNNLTSNADLVSADNAKKILEANISISKEFALGLKDILTNNKKAIGIDNINVENFYKSYLSSNNSYLLPYITLEESKSQTNEPSSSNQGSNENSDNSAGGSSSQQSSQNSKQKLSYDGSFCLLKNGTIVETINKDQTLALNIINKKVNKGLIQLKNVTDKSFKNADVSLEILDKKVSKDFQLIKNTPYLTYNIFLFVKLEEIFSKDFDSEVLNTVFDVFGESTLSKTVETINTSTANIIELSKKHKVDIFNIINQVKATNYKEYEKLISNNLVNNLIEDAIIVFNYEFAIRN